MSVTIQDNFSTAAAKPIDDRYGPYANVAAANAAIPEIFRYKGLTVGIGTPVEEYWWANGVTDPDLVQKTATGNVTGITQGTGIIVDNTNPQIPDVSVDTSYVQVVSNLSTSVPTDGTSDVKYPSVKAVKDYADGLVVGLLNDRGSWAAGASPGAYPTNPPATGSGPGGSILKGDIWFINTAGYLGTTYVSIGSSVRALIDNPNPSTDADWDIIDAGLGFTPENITNKVSTGANVNADPTSTVKYPSVRALVEYVQTYAPAPTTPDLQAVTNVGASTTNSIAAQAFGFYDSSTSSYAALSCDATGSPSRILIEDSYASPRLSLDTAGTDLTVWANTGSTQAVLEFGSVSGIQTYTFPNATGTIALLSSLSGTSPISYDPITGIISISQASGSADGYLTQGDWNIFNNKQNSLSGSGIVKSTAGVISYISGTASQFVKGDGSLDSTVYLSSSSASTTYVPYTGATTNVNLGTTVATGKNLYCSSIGIGTNSVSGRLHISSQGDGGGDINVLFTQGIVNSLISTGIGPNGMTIGTTTSSNTYIQAEGLKVITVTPSPFYYVGIGTMSPSTKLEVNGAIKTSSPNAILSGGALFAEASLFFKNTVNPSTTSPGYDAVHSGGSLITSGYNGLYTKKQDAGYFYTLLEFPASTSVGTTINCRYKFPSLGASNGYVSAMTDGNASSANNYIIKAIDTTGQINRSNIYEDPTTANIGVGTSTPNASAILELNSTTKGFRLPRMGTGSFPASPVKALMVHADADNDIGRPVGGVFVYDNSKWNNIPYRSYLVYTAIINQSGTNAPTVVATLENNIGTISFSRTSAGVYLISSTNFNGFTSANKVVVFVTNGQSTTGIYKAQYVPPTSAVQLESLNLSGVSADSLINNMNIEIRMYI